MKDSEDEDIDFSFRDTSENVFQEALKTYCDNNKSRREYEKRMGMITDEERLRVKELVLCQDLVQVKMRNFSPF